VTTDGKPPTTAGALLESAGWSALLDRIIRGVCHDLNSRVSSLMAVTQLMQLGEPVPEAFRDETAKLEELARLLQLIPAIPEAEADARLPQDLVAEALTLHAKARDKGYARPPRVSVEEGTPAILVGAGRAVRAIALVIDRLGRDWDRLDRPVVIRGNAKAAHIDLPTVAPVDPGPWAATLSTVFAMDAGSFSVSEDGATISFPSLEVARASK
jgi:hypothetical protein